MIIFLHYCELSDILWPTSCLAAMQRCIQVRKWLLEQDFLFCIFSSFVSRSEMTSRAILWKGVRGVFVKGRRGGGTEILQAKHAMIAETRFFLEVLNALRHYWCRTCSYHILHIVHTLHIRRIYWLQWLSWMCTSMDVTHVKDATYLAQAALPTHPAHPQDVKGALRAVEVARLHSLQSLENSQRM